MRRKEGKIAGGARLYSTLLGMGLALCALFGVQGRTQALSQEERVFVNGVNLATTQEGEGYPVVLMHGNGGSREDLRTQRQQLAEAHFRVYSFDSRGQGENEPLSSCHYEEMAEDAYELIKHWGLERPFFYGWSDGGIVGLLLEIRHPGTLGAYAGSGVNADPKGLSLPVHLGFWFGSLFDPSGLARMVVKEPNISLEELGSLKLPVLLTAGERDIVREEHTRWLAQAIPGARLEILEGEDHGSYIYHSPKLGEVLVPFFQEALLGLEG